MVNLELKITAIYKARVNNTSPDFITSLALNSLKSTEVFVVTNNGTLA